MVHDFIEPVTITDTFATGVARVEPLGNGLVRLTFYSEQQSLYEDSAHGVVVARIIIPVRNLISARPAVDIAAEHIEGAVGDILISRGRLDH